MKIQSYYKNQKKYTGYKEVILTEEELAEFYNFTYITNENKYKLLPNEYLILKDNDGNIIYQYLWTGKEYKDIHWYNLESKMMGELKPKDIYQRLALDSIKRNQLTVLRGRAGTGKSLIGLSYFFHELELERIDKIVMFVNPVATKDSCKFGFLPGSATEKILGSQIGKFLLTKIGDMSMVEKLIAEEKLVLIPVADCRGLDTSGLNAGIYITEAQNTTKDMMKLILQRIDDNTKVIIEGDDNAQVDMNTYAGYNNGLRRLSEVFRGENYYGEITLKNCYRSKIADKAEKM
jgi:predicted ribonuclease YlaK